MLVNFLNLSLLSALVLPLVTLAAPRGSGSKHVKHTDVRMTFYDVDNGNQVSCGGYHKNNEPIVALSIQSMNKTKMCGRRIKITYKTIERSATIVDTCMGCPKWGIDLARGLFTDFERESVGVIHGDWVFEDESPSPSPPPPTRPSKQSLPPPPPPPPPSSSSDSYDPLCEENEPFPTENPTPPPEMLPSPQPSNPNEYPNPTESPNPNESPSPTESPNPNESPSPTESPIPSDAPPKYFRGTSATLPATIVTRPGVPSSSRSSYIRPTASPRTSVHSPSKPAPRK